MAKRKSIIGTRVKIEYLDQNDGFASLLPRRGTVIRQLRAEQDIGDWFLIMLDNPFDYQIKNSDPFSLTGLHCENVLIRSRWKGYRIGENKPTSVFIFLIRDKGQLKTEPIKIEHFYHVAWGMCSTEQTPKPLNIKQS